MSYTTKSILSTIPAGSDIAFITSTLFLNFINVGHAPFFTNSIFPVTLLKTDISIVAYVSSFEFKLTDEFISPIEISLSNFYNC